MNPCDLYPVHVPTDAEYAEFRRLDGIYQRAKALLRVKSDKDFLPAVEGLVRRHAKAIVT